MLDPKVLGDLIIGLSIIGIAVYGEFRRIKKKKEYINSMR